MSITDLPYTKCSYLEFCFKGSWREGSYSDCNHCHSYWPCYHCYGPCLLGVYHFVCHFNTIRNYVATLPKAGLFNSQLRKTMIRDIMVVVLNSLFYTSWAFLDQLLDNLWSNSGWRCRESKNSLQLTLIFPNYFIH